MGATLLGGDIGTDLSCGCLYMMSRHQRWGFRDSYVKLAIFLGPYKTSPIVIEIPFLVRIPREAKNVRSFSLSEFSSTIRGALISSSTCP